jgi:ATP-dependent protease ClpP protease subunit
MNSIDAYVHEVHNYNIDIKNREVYLHSYMSESDDEGGVDFRSAIVFAKNIRLLNIMSSEPILVHMHIPGGVWEDGLGIYDTIKYSKAKVSILAYAKVESASSIIFQAAHKRVLMPNTHTLIHYGSLSIDDEHRAAKSTFEWSEKESLKMINIFTDKCAESPLIKEKKNWNKYIIKKHIMSQLANRSDWILDAEEAVHYGFADGVLGDRKFPNIDSLKKYKK